MTDNKEDDYVTKDKDGNEINLDDHTMIYIQGIQLIRDVYLNDIEKTNKAFYVFFRELRATFVGLIGGIDKVNRNSVINMLFSTIELMKKHILSDIQIIDSEKGK